MNLKMPSGEVLDVQEPADLTLFITRLEDTILRIREDIVFAKKKARQLSAWPTVEAGKEGAK